MLVREIAPGVFDVARDVEPGLEFAQGVQIDALGLYRVLPEDTTPPTPFHQPAALTFQKAGEAVQAVCVFALMQNIAEAKQIARALVAHWHAERHGALKGRALSALETERAARLKAINGARTITELVTLSNSWQEPAQ